jgi:hypothetical protein
LTHQVLRINDGAGLVQTPLRERNDGARKETMKENVQIIAWTIEIIVFLTAIAIGRFVWRLGKRKSREKKVPSEPR